MKYIKIFALLWVVTTPVAYMLNVVVRYRKYWNNQMHIYPSKRHCWWHARTSVNYDIKQAFKKA